MRFGPRKAAAFILLFLALGAPVAAMGGKTRLEDLPAVVRQHVEDVRERCREANPNFKPFDLMQGVTTLDLDRSGAADFMVDDAELCAPMMEAGVNCTNRGCDLKIWKQTGRARWQMIFNQHLHRKFISMSADGRLALIAASIYAGSPECRADPKTFFTSGQSCDVLFRYRRGKWTSERVN